jgi:peptidyl-prolyl cis-trans isomerase D
MLQAIRSKTASIVVKLLAGLLIISFAAWGIEDFIGSKASELTVATVGDRDIDPVEFDY